MADGYPTFAGLFARDPRYGTTPPYLILLNLGRDDAVGVVGDLHAAAARSPDLDSELLALLAERNWRPTLVAAAAASLRYGTERVVAALWTTFDRGSWVSPQLAVAASLRDPEFEREAQQRIDAWRSPTPAWRDPKALSALIGLCRDRPSCAAWLETLLPDPEIVKALAHDRLYDQGDRIATRWLERMEQLRAP